MQLMYIHITQDQSLWSTDNDQKVRVKFIDIFDKVKITLNINQEI